MNKIFKPYILWLGGVFDEEMVANSHAVSPAANLWQEGLIKAIKDRGLPVINICHLPEPLWPKGKFRLKGSTGILAKGIKGEIVNYYNLPFWRHQSLKKAYLNAFNSMIKKEGKPMLLVTYNLAYQNIVLGRYAQEKLKIPWVCIIADQMKKYEISKTAKGRIFLSWFGYKNCLHEPKFHLDGGIDKLYFTDSINVHSRKNNKSIILYTGSLGRWAGVRFLIKGFKLVKNQNVELWICGKGTSNDIKREIALDPRVKFLGFVSKEHLEEIYKAADIFVNPRLPFLPENRYNFPSKLPKYLAYCKPIISTWTEGLSPEYREVLIVPKEETVESLAKTIEDALEREERCYRELAGRIKIFLEFNKLWSIQASRLVKWLEIEIFTKL